MAVWRCLVLVSGMLSLPVFGDPLLIRYENYPPFVWGEEGRVQGEFALHTQKIAGAARLDLAWHKGTYKRIMRDLYDNVGQFCVTGYSYSQGREHLVQHTDAYGRFPPGGIAVLKENLAVFKYHAHIYDVLADPTISGVFIEGAKYGPEFSRRVAAGKDRHLHVSGGDEDLVFLLTKGRVHFAMINSAQVEYFRSRMAGAETLVALQPGGMSKGSAVHMLCTRNTPKAIIKKLNVAISSIGVLSAPHN